MILATGGRASGATSTRSRPRSTAAASASSTVITPSCSPSGAMTRMGLVRICRFTRMRGALLLVLSIARFGSPPQESEKRTPAAPESAIASRRPPAEGSRHRNPRALSEPPERRRVRRPRAPAYRIVGTKLSGAERLHKPEPLAVPPQPPRHRLGVVLEQQQPPLRFRATIQATLALERDERLEVVAHDPRER